MSTALFTNFTNEVFNAYWNGKKKTFKPGQSVYMPDSLARHFAKHLTNKELLRRDERGVPIYPDGEKFTSPKKPEDAALFMELFNKAYAPETAGDQTPDDDIDTMIDVANKNREEKGLETNADIANESTDVKDNEVHQLPPEDDEDANEESFENQPVDEDANEESFENQPVDEDANEEKLPEKYNEE